MFGTYPKRYDLWIVFLVSLLIRTVFFFLSASQLGAESYWTLSPDTQHYLEIATDFINGSDTAGAYVFSFGPGFGALLALAILIFGQHAVPIIIVNIIFSSLSCTLICPLAHELRLSRATGLVAAALLAVLPTSISLSCLILSDTVFVFLLLLGALCYLHGLKSDRWAPFLIGGVVFSVAVLVRAVGQLMPVVLTIVALPWLLRSGVALHTHFGLNRPLLVRVLVCVAIIGGTEIGWMTRNYVRHDVFAMSSGGAGGVANVAAFAVERVTGTPMRQVRAGWHETYHEQHGIVTRTLATYDAADRYYSAQVFNDHPWDMIRAYLTLSWENMTAINYLNRSLLPDSKPRVVKLEHFFLDNYWNTVGVWMSLAGLLVLLLRRQFRTALFVGLLFGHFALIIGFTRWQGSRLFFPAEIASAILIAVLLVACARIIGKSLAVRDWLRPRNR